MSDKLEELKVIFRNKMIKQILETGVPPSKKWPLPELFRQNSTILSGFLTEEGFEMYLDLSEDEQNIMIEYIENCGPELAEMLDCELFEDWDKDPIMVSDEKINELREKYNLDLNVEDY